jgi:hypothetical protein
MMLPGKNRTINGFHQALAVLALGAVTVREASAYADPGTGALLWQMIAAGFVGLLFYFRKFTSWFGRKKDKARIER